MQAVPPLAVVAPWMIKLPEPLSVMVPVPFAGLVPKLLRFTPLLATVTVPPEIFKAPLPPSRPIRRELVIFNAPPETLIVPLPLGLFPFPTQSDSVVESFERAPVILRVPPEIFSTPVVVWPTTEMFEAEERAKEVDPWLEV